MAQLDWEWDVERAINANYAVVTGLGIALGRFVDRRFYAVAAGFLMQHAVQGWCPPVSVLRRLGFRTTGEIESERKLLREAIPDRPSDLDPMTWCAQRRRRSARIR